MNIFDLWNISKKKINQRLRIIYPKNRQIWWCNLGQNVVYEQNGKGNKFTRPVLIIKSFKESCIIVPLTTTKNENKFLVDIGLIKNRRQKVCISQIRFIDSKRLINKIHIINKQDFNNILKSIKSLF